MKGHSRYAWSLDDFRAAPSGPPDADADETRTERARSLYTDREERYGADVPSRSDLAGDE